MILPINPPREVTVEPGVPAVPGIPPIKQESAEVDVITINDNTINAVVALIRINGLAQALTLWQGSEYIAIGNWTQEQANARILELI
jgi:hypothetical protein